MLLLPTEAKIAVWSGQQELIGVERENIGRSQCMCQCSESYFFIRSGTWTYPMRKVALRSLPIGATLINGPQVLCVVIMLHYVVRAEAPQTTRGCSVSSWSYPHFPEQASHESRSITKIHFSERLHAKEGKCYFFSSPGRASPGAPRSLANSFRLLPTQYAAHICQSV